MEFQTPRGREIPELVIDSAADGSGRGRQVPLRLRYDRIDKDISINCSPSLKLLDQRNNRAGLITFTVEVTSTGVVERVSYIIAKYSGQVLGTMQQLDETLRVRIGKVTKHNNFESDLLAQTLGMSSDADLLLAYWRVLAAKNNVDLPRVDWDQLNDNPVKQNTGTDHTKWNCGGALMTFGQRYAPKHYTSGTTPYYDRPAPSKLSRVVFNKNTARTGAEKIRRLLSNGNFVQVFVGHHEDVRIENGLIRPSDNTHYLSLFGCSRDGKEFLFFDPWPQGSILNYQSGILGTVRSLFMGRIAYFDDEGKIRSPMGVEGSHKNYVILEGP
jgi:hypothetical protein